MSGDACVCFSPRRGADIRILNVAQGTLSAFGGHAAAIRSRRCCPKGLAGARSFNPASASFSVSNIIRVNLSHCQLPLGFGKEGSEQPLKRRLVPWLLAAKPTTSAGFSSPLSRPALLH